jgi:hypothetical protein
LLRKFGVLNFEFSIFNAIATFQQPQTLPYCLPNQWFFVLRRALSLPRRWQGSDVQRLNFQKKRPPRI